MSAFALLRIFREAVAAVEPRTAVMRALSLNGGVLCAADFPTGTNVMDLQAVTVRSGRAGAREQR